MIAPTPAHGKVKAIADLGIGKLTFRWMAAVAILACLVLVGLYSYAQQEIYGESVTGMATIGSGGAAWGLYIVFAVFFIGVSFAGISVAALIRLFGIQPIKHISRMAELLTIIALMMGALCIMADLGDPLKGLLNLPRYARTMSPFFGTFSMVIGGYLSASLLYFFLAGRADAAYMARYAPWGKFFYRLWATGYRGTQAERNRHQKTSFWLSLMILPLLITAHSTLGFIFGIQGGRPGWFNALQAPGFVVMAGVSGLGVIIVAVALMRWLLRLEKDIGLPTFRWLGNSLLVLSGVYIYFMIADQITANYAGVAAEARISHEIVFGAYAVPFWITVGCLVAGFAILFLQFVTGKSMIAWTVTAGLLVNVAAVLKRFLIVVPSQTYGTMLPWEPGSYTPSKVELGLIIGLFGLGTLMYITFLKVFPIVPMESHEEVSETEKDELPESGMRTVAMWLTLALGLAMAITGFLISARFGTEPTSDPIMPFSPVLFIAGVVTMFGSAVVYELFPDRASLLEPEQKPEDVPGPGEHVSMTPKEIVPAQKGQEKGELVSAGSSYRS